MATTGASARRLATSAAVPKSSSICVSTAFATTAYTSLSTSFRWIRSTASSNSSSLHAASSCKLIALAHERKAFRTSVCSTPVFAERLAGYTESQGTSSSATSGKRRASRKRENSSRGFRQFKPSSSVSGSDTRSMSCSATSIASSTSSEKRSGTSVSPISPAASRAFPRMDFSAVASLPSPGASLSRVSTVTSDWTPSEYSSFAGRVPETLTTSDSRDPGSAAPKATTSASLALSLASLLPGEAAKAINRL
mmetsp:Transcript_37570/g.101682  ORF Transcript_37570/g.101682 Transcript_37570/m.101682 type:complete len:252 (+) Transcript_37570:192-947(+)